MVCCELVRGVAAVAQPVCLGPEGRRPTTAMVADRLIPATTTGVSALSQPAGASRCRTSRSARYPAVIAAPRPPSVRSAAASGRRRRTAIAHACAASITRGADSAVPISTQSRPTVDGCPRQNGMSKAWRRRRASAVPPSPAASWAVATKASTRFPFMARQLNGPSPMAAILLSSSAAAAGSRTANPTGPVAKCSLPADSCCQNLGMPPIRKLEDPEIRFRMHQPEAENMLVEARQFTAAA